jgi:hypothetical protein
MKGMEIYVYSDKEGIVHAVLVKYTAKAAKGIANMPAQSKPSK